MSESSSGTDESARKMLSTALRRIARQGQNNIAAAMSISPTTVSRHLSDEECLLRSMRILAAAGLKVVPVEMRCFAPAKVEILLSLSRDYLARMRSADDLGEVDDE